MNKTVLIDGKAVEFRSTAAVPRLYRLKFKRDIFIDLTRVRDAVAAEKERQNKTKESASMLPPDTLELFENIAYIMAKHANKHSVPDSVEAWLDSFETFSIYDVLPAILEMWTDNTAQLSTAAKK